MAGNDLSFGLALYEARLPELHTRAGRPCRPTRVATDFLAFTCIAFRFRRDRTEHKTLPRKEIRRRFKYQKKLQNPPLWAGPRKFEKKCRMARKWPENGHFRIFSFFFGGIFGVQPRVGDFLFCFVNICLIPSLAGFCAL